MPSIPQPVDSEIFWAMTVSGMNRKDPKTVMGALYGDWERFWDDPTIRDCDVPPGDCLSLPRLQLWSFIALAPGPIPCSEFRSISIHTLETATHKKCAP